MKKQAIKGISPTKAKPLEQRIREAMTSKEPIGIEATEGTYYEAKKGVVPEFNIRTDRQILALDAIEKVGDYRTKLQKSKEGETLRE